MRNQHIALPGLLLALTPGVFAQGDDCGTATAIMGLGSHVYDSTTNGVSGFDGGGACGAGSDDVGPDVFWQWTATSAGDFIFDTTGSSYDTKLSVHAGTGCAATCVGYNDDANGTTQSEVTVAGVNIGDTLLVQAGGWNGNAGPGALNITLLVDPCAGTTDDALEENDDCSSATPMNDGTFPGLYATKADKDHYAICVADGATVTVDVINDPSSAGDMDANLWDPLDGNCGTGFGNGALVEGFSNGDETLVWTNTTGADMDVIVEVNNWDNPGVADCGNYDLEITGSSNCNGGTGTPFCAPMDSNSTGASTTLSAAFGSGVGSDLHLEATNGPSGEFGYFLVGNAFSEPGIAISNGRLCLDPLNGNTVGRYNFSNTDRHSIGQFDGAGVLQNIVGTSAVGSGYDVPLTLPIPGSPSIMAGETWHFQVWHRDTPAGAGQSNFSNGLSVSF